MAICKENIQLVFHALYTVYSECICDLNGQFDFCASLHLRSVHVPASKQIMDSTLMPKTNAKQMQSG